MHIKTKPNEPMPRLIEANYKRVGARYSIQCSPVITIDFAHTKPSAQDSILFGKTNPILSPLCRHILGLAVACHSLR